MVAILQMRREKGRNASVGAPKLGSGRIGILNPAWEILCRSSHVLPNGASTSSLGFQAT